MLSNLRDWRIPVPTPRLLVVALCGSPLVLFGGSFLGAVILGVLWLIGIAVLAIVDAQFAPRAAVLEWARDHDAKLSLGTWNLISVKLHNAGRHTAHIRVRDAVPRLLQPRGEGGAGTCAARATWQFTYRVFPIHRGDYALGPLSIRSRGPLGLAWRPSLAAAGDTVKVYPNLLAVRTYAALERVGHLEQSGLVRARRWGEGTEFQRLREYTPDDEYRRIDWKATARRQSPIVADYQPERSQNVILALDTGRMMSMRVPIGDSENSGEARSSIEPDALPTPLTRLDYSLNAALLLSYVAERSGDRIGLLAFSDRVTRFLSPRPGRRQFLAITDALYDLEAEPTEPDFGQGLAYLAARIHRRSLVVLFTDFAGTEGADVLVQGMAHIARRHLGLVVTVRDPATHALATQPLLDSRAVYERAVARGLLDARASVLRRLQRAGVLTVDATAAAISPTVINRYLRIKARGQL